MLVKALRPFHESIKYKRIIGASGSHNSLHSRFNLPASNSYLWELHCFPLSQSYRGVSLPGHYGYQKSIWKDGYCQRIKQWRQWCLQSASFFLNRSPETVILSAEPWHWADCSHMDTRRYKWNCLLGDKGQARNIFSSSGVWLFCSMVRINNTITKHKYRFQVKDLEFILKNAFDWFNCWKKKRERKKKRTRNLWFAESQLVK